MPRDGSGIYTKPFSDVVTGTTIESAVHNGTVSDVETDLNWPRPIIAGGTGANNATAARDNLDVEVAGKEVTNYDSHVWEHGSFWSQASATAAPVAGQFFTGNATMINNDQSYVVLSARSYNDGKSYYRIKTAGVWGTWTLDGAADYINATGDTMTGNLLIQNTNPSISLDAKPGDLSAGFSLQRNTQGRWTVFMGQGPDTATSTGSDFVITRFDNSGGVIDAPFTISRMTGAITLSGPVSTATGPIISPAYWTAVDQARGMTSDGTNLQLRAGIGSVVFQTGSSAVLGSFSPAGLLSTAGSANIGGTNIDLGGANLVVSNGTKATINQAMAAAKNGEHRVSTAGSGNYYDTAGNTNRMFVGSGISTDTFRIYHGASGDVFTLNSGGIGITGNGFKPGGGPWGDSSDTRIKTITGTYDSGLAAILALQPKRFVYKGNDTIDPPANTIAVMEGVENKTAPTVPYENSPHYGAANDGTEFIGLVAQDAESVMPEVVGTRAGYIDGQPVDDLRTVDQGPLVFALINAVKELSARIEALEAA